MTASLDELLAGVPGPAAVDAAVVARRSRDAGRVLVVLDDDPTGTQSVAGLPVLLDRTSDSFRWAFAAGAPAVYVLTNSRSLAPRDARRVTRESVRAALEAARATGIRLSFVSRSDSTLRGHFPLEPDAIAAELAAAGEAVTAVLVVPAFGDAGRVTVRGVHHARDGDDYRPVGETEFARDASFGYLASDLAGWVAEKTGGAVRAADVPLIDLATLRTDPAAVAAALADARGPIVADAVTEDDLRLLALGVLAAEERGARIVVRSGPPWPRARIGLAPPAPLAGRELAALRARVPADAAPGGLVVVGSHVSATTRQLEELLRRRAPRLVELDVARLAGTADDATGAAPETGTRGSEVAAGDEELMRAAADETAAALADGDVVLATSRRLVTGGSPEASLAVARRVSSAVVAIVAGVVARRPPAFVVAKGGITSSDVATRGLGIGRATVVGPMLPGIVSLWAGEDGPARGIPYVVFAGNVGSDGSLADVVDALSPDAGD